VLGGDEPIDPAAATPGWRAALDLLADPFGGDSVLEDVVDRWLDAALAHPSLRAGIASSFVEAARPVPGWPRDRYGIEPVRRDPTTAKVMIGMVRRWATTDLDRRRLKDDIVIPLTYPWWLRLLTILYVHVRAFWEMERQQS